MHRNLRKSEILRGRGAFREVYNRGMRVSGDALTCFVLRRNEGTQPVIKVGFGVNAKALTAVSRNRIKRLLREAYRSIRNRLPEESLHRSVSLIFTLTSSVGTSPSFADLHREMESMLRTILAESTTREQNIR